MDGQKQERQAHLQLIKGATADRYRHSADEGLLHNIKIAPLFSRKVRRALEDGEVLEQAVTATSMFPQYGFLGLRDATFSSDGGQDRSPPREIRDQDMVYANINAPWSAFICGSQGGGKSHTLSCMLENALLSNSVAGVLPNPLAGIVFHYDRFASYQSTQFCEAAYLCSWGIPVKVLVSPVSLPTMRRLYANLPGLPANAPQPTVEPLYLSERQLNNTNMMKLMAVDDGARTPLYLDVIKHILREMALKKDGDPGINYQEFKKKIEEANFTKDQSTPLNMRLQLLEAFLVGSADTKNIWDFNKGTLTIVDLSCPFVNENEACALFTICLGLCMEGRSKVGRIVALDEAHKASLIDLRYTPTHSADALQFLTQSGDAETFTNELIEAICQQRHIATRILIATQEPTLSPRLLDLCSVTIIHRFRSPAWFETLKAHLAGVRDTKDSRSASDSVFRTIVGLRTGQALLFCPEAMLDLAETESDELAHRKEIRELKDSFIQIRIRERVTADGGRSVMASDTIPGPQSHNERFKSTSSSERPELRKIGESRSEENGSAQTRSDEASSGEFRSGESQSSGEASVSDEKPKKTGQASSKLASRPKLQPDSQKLKAATIPAPASSAPPTSLPVAPPSAPTHHGAVGGTIGWSGIKNCLNWQVNRSLGNDSSSLDFGVIRRTAEKELNLTMGTLRKDDDSGDIIKKACKKHFSDLGYPLPKWVNWQHP